VVVRVEVRQEILEWARERARLDVSDLAERFPKLVEWEAGEARPTLKQLERFAQATHTPVGYLLLDEPPDEPVPIPDFRTMANTTVGRPSADLLDTIYQSQQRQEWYRDYTLSAGDEQLSFIGSLTASSDVVAAAGIIRSALDFDVDARGNSWSAALTRLIEQAESIGILVMVNGIVGSNTHRKLDPEEFRGFALVDDLAPVVFINGADTKAAQIFTLAHELAHQWLGETALSDARLEAAPSNPIERWCNRVAAELLVPLADLRQQFEPRADLTSELDRLAARFRVSTLVVLRRVRDAEFIDANNYPAAYRAELRRVLDLMGERGSGGNFYNTLPIRVSKRFARALIANTLEGKTLYRDAFQMLGFRKLSTFRELSEKLGVTG
jgi:Zn-dependent peptidase ImmA (M78 family)/transcriptional regulator with XRE-family HTH domain